MTLYAVKQGGFSHGAATTKSHWLLNPVSRSIKIVELCVSFDSAVSGAGFAVELYRVTTIGSAAGTTYTPVKVNGGADVAACATTALIALGTEPTAVETLAEWMVQPFGGNVLLQYPQTREPFTAQAGQRLGIRTSTPAGATTCNSRGYVWFDE